MYKFLLFLKKIIFVLLFIVIESVALHYYSESSSYNQAKLINVSNRLVGDIYAGMAGIKQYFLLGAENRKLTAEVVSLREALRRYEYMDTLRGIDSLRVVDSLRYEYSSARVVNNSIVRNENFITLDKGTRDGVEPYMGVLSDGAVVGYVLDCNDRFSVAVSILNTKFRTSGRILGEDYTGSVFWDGKNSEEVILSEVPKYAELEKGDTIVTTEYSSFFPAGMKIGRVQDFELVNGTYYQARIKLFANMGALNNVVLVKYRDLEEKTELEEKVRNRTDL